MSGTVHHKKDGSSSNLVPGKYWIVKKRGVDVAAQEAFAKSIEELREKEARDMLSGSEYSAVSSDDMEGLVASKKDSFCETMFRELNEGRSMVEVFGGVAGDVSRMSSKKLSTSSGASGQFADDGLARMFDIGNSKMNIVYREASKRFCVIIGDPTTTKCGLDGKKEFQKLVGAVNMRSPAGAAGASAMGLGFDTQDNNALEIALGIDPVSHSKEGGNPFESTKFFSEHCVPLVSNNPMAMGASAWVEDPNGGAMSISAGERSASMRRKGGSPNLTPGRMARAQSSDPADIEDFLMQAPGSPMRDLNRHDNGRRLSLRGQRKARRASVLWKNIAALFADKASVQAVALHRRLTTTRMMEDGMDMSKAMNVGGVPRYNLRQPGFEILPVFVFLSGSSDADATKKAEHNMLRLPATKAFYEAATDCHIEIDRSTGYYALRENADPSSKRCARFIIAKNE